MTERHGFSLLEVLIALGILGIGIIAIMQVFPASLYQARLATERVPAVNWAKGQFDVLKTRGTWQDRTGTVNVAWPDDPIARQYVASTLTPSQQIDLELTSEAYKMYRSAQWNVHRIGLPDIIRPMQQATQIYALHRVTLSVPLMDGREEKFVTYITKH